LNIEYAKLNEWYWYQEILKKIIDLFSHFFETERFFVIRIHNFPFPRT